MPLIVRDPRPEADATRGTVVDAFTEHVDVMPTICTWLGLEVPLAVRRRALQPFLHDGDGRPPDWRTEGHWEWDFRSPAAHIAEDMLGVPMEQCTLDVVRDEHWKYVHFAADADVCRRCCSTSTPIPTRSSGSGRRPGPRGGAWPTTRQRLLSWRMRHDERTLTGHYLSPRKGLVVRRDPRR